MLATRLHNYPFVVNTKWCYKISVISVTFLIWFQFQVVIGGPLQTDIERIIRERAQLVDSVVFSAFDPCISSNIKQYQIEHEIPVQICDIQIQIKNMVVPIPSLQTLCYALFFSEFRVWSLNWSIWLYLGTVYTLLYIPRFPRPPVSKSPN